MTACRCLDCQRVGNEIVVKGHVNVSRISVVVSKRHSLNNKRSVNVERVRVGGVLNNERYVYKLGLVRIVVNLFKRAVYTGINVSVRVGSYVRKVIVCAI